MATKAEIQSQIDSLVAANQSLSTKVTTSSNDAKYAYDAWQSAENAPASDSYVFNGRTFNSRSDYISALYEDFNQKRSTMRSYRDEFNSNVEKQNQLKEQLAAATDDTKTVRDTEGVTNKSESDKKDEASNQDPSLTPNEGVQRFDDGSTLQTFDDGSTLATDSDGNISTTSADETRVPTTDSGAPIPKGAEQPATGGSKATWAGTKDLRTLLRVPSSYLVGPAAGPSSILKTFGGILFPYTPSIGWDNQASYTSVNPVHSNYTQYFYRNSTVGPISVSGKFTVQNEHEAAVFLAIQHLLRSLTKMRFGTDSNAGSPPPVCRLDAYGDMMLSNVPVSVASWKVELPDSVDYIAVKDSAKFGNYATTMAPVVSTLSITLNLMYSRKEIREFSVDGWLNNKLKNKGYL